MLMVGWLLHSTDFLISNISCSKMNSYDILFITLFLGNKIVQDFLFEINLIDLFIFSNTKVMYATFIARLESIMLENFRHNRGWKA